MNPHQKMYLRMILRSLRGRLSRVLIASLSIAVGAATLCGLGLVAYIVPAQIAKELRSYGANLIVVPAATTPLTDDDMVLADGLTPDVLARAPYQYTNLLYNQQPITTMATSLTDAQNVRPFWEIEGALPSEKGQIMVGQKVADRYGFSVGDGVGLTPPDAKEGSRPPQLTVSAILHTGGPEDDLVVMSFDTLSDFTNASGQYTLIEYSIQADQERLETFAANINKASDNARAEVVRRVSQSETGVAATLQTLIWIVSAIISLLTVISISATLNAVISERSREIGLKKALGAYSRDISWEFVGESVLLGIVGGLTGAFAGIWMASFISESAFAVKLSAPWWVIPATVILAVIIALVGTLMPARRIARIKPVDVLGGE